MIDMIATGYASTKHEVNIFDLGLKHEAHLGAERRCGTSSARCSHRRHLRGQIESLCQAALGMVFLPAHAQRLNALLLSRRRSLRLWVPRCSKYCIDPALLEVLASG
jgi:hypothetical protein